MTRIRREHGLGLLFSASFVWVTQDWRGLRREALALSSEQAAGCLAPSPLITVVPVSVCTAGILVWRLVHSSTVSAGARDKG